MENTNPARLLTETEAAKFLAVSPITLRQQRSQGARDRHMPVLPYVKLGFSVRYRMSDIENFIQQNMVTGVTESAR